MGESNDWEIIHQLSLYAKPTWLREIFFIVNFMTLFSCLGSPWAAAFFRAHLPFLAQSPHGLQGENLSHHGNFQGLQLSLGSSLGAPPPIFFSGLGACRSISFIFPHSSLLASVAQQASPFLKYVITEVPWRPLMSSALSSDGSVLESSESASVSVWHGNNYWCHLTEATSAAPWFPLLSIEKKVISFNMLKQQQQAIYSTARFLFWCRWKIFPSFSFKKILFANSKTELWPKCYIVTYWRVKMA